LDGRNIASLKGLFKLGCEGCRVINHGRCDQIEAATMGHGLPLSRDGRGVKAVGQAMMTIASLERA
jgi:hypothetical protein